MKLSEAKIDVVVQEQGDWVDNIPELPGVRIKTRGAGNKSWRRRQQQLFDTIPRHKKVGGRIDPEELDRVATALVLDCGIIDWEGLEDDEGKPIPFTKEMASKLFNDPTLAKLREGAVWAANIVAEQRNAEVEDVVKN